LAAEKTKSSSCEDTFLFKASIVAEIKSSKRRETSIAQLEKMEGAKGKRSRDYEHARVD
jgi:hypothetical protein